MNLRESSSRLPPSIDGQHCSAVYCESLVVVSSVSLYIAMKFILIASLLPSLGSCFTIPTRTALRTNTALQAVNGENGAAEKKKVIVLGGDGFCGWPTSLYLSDQGHDITIVDNLSRRNIDTELGCDSLTPIQPMEVCGSIACCCWCVYDV